MAGELIAFCTSTHNDCLTAETLNSFEHEVRTNCKKKRKEEKRTNCRQTDNVTLRVCSVGRQCAVLRRVWALESGLDFSPSVSLDQLT